MKKTFGLLSDRLVTFFKIAFPFLISAIVGLFLFNEQGFGWEVFWVVALGGGYLLSKAPLLLINDLPLQRSDIVLVQVALQLSSLRRQFLVCALLVGTFGGASVYFAAQTIFDTGNSQLEFSGKSYLQQSLEDNIRLRDGLNGDLASNVLTEQGRNETLLSLKAIENTISLIDSQISRSTGRSVTEPNGDISSEFLFQFFSNLFVRLGTIAILMFLFGISFGQFRRVSRRLNGLRQIKLAYLIAKSDSNLEKVAEGIVLSKINDEPIKIEKGSPETAFSDSLTSSIRDLAARLPIVKVGKVENN